MVAVANPAEKTMILIINQEIHSLTITFGGVQTKNGLLKGILLKKTPSSCLY
jgi:hypothetical protein